jgi:holo-[acyl-carrier protein] synthase
MDLRVGIDLVAVDHVRESLRVHGGDYVARVCTDDEQRQCTAGDGFDAAGVAARVAGKEAAFKALRPVDTALPWRSVEILEEGSTHAVRLSGEAAARAREHGLVRWDVAISASAGYVSAVVTAEGVAR